MHITHWIPAGEPPRWPCVESWTNLQLPKNAQRRFIFSRGADPEIHWNKAVTDFLASDSDWLLSTHNDVVFVPETLTRLLSWNKPLVSALVFMRQSPVVPHIWNAYTDEQRQAGQYIQRINDTREWFYDHKEYIRFGPFVMEPRPDNALVEIDFTSTSCVLIHRTVLESIRKEHAKWFEWDRNPDGTYRGGEDRRFFEYAKQAGFTAYVDRSCVAGHLCGDIPTSVAEFIAWDSVSTFNSTGEQSVNSE